MYHNSQKSVSVNVYLRVRPLEQKHKLKEDYFVLSNYTQNEEQKSNYPTGITIHDPLKRSKDQYEFKLDKIYTQDKSNAVLLADQQARIDRLLNYGENQLILSFGHKDSGKSYTVIGENNFQLEKNLVDVDIHNSDDSRGLILRYAYAILKKDPRARLGVSYVDVVMDNVRDLLKYVKKDQRKNQQSSAANLGFEEYSTNRFNSNIDQGEFNINIVKNNYIFKILIHNQLIQLKYYNQKFLMKNFNITQAQNIEKEFLEIHERPGLHNSIYYLKNLTYIDNIKDVSEIAYYLDRGSPLSEHLNKKLNYTPGLRPIQIFQLAVKSSKNGKDCQLIFIDMPDYEKLQTNIIDNQKLYESIVINNNFNQNPKTPKSDVQ